MSEENSKPQPQPELFEICIIYEAIINHIIKVLYFNILILRLTPNFNKPFFTNDLIKRCFKRFSFQGSHTNIILGTRLRVYINSSTQNKHSLAK